MENSTQDTTARLLLTRPRPNPIPQHWPLSLPILLVTQVWPLCAIPLVLVGEPYGPMEARAATRPLCVRPRPTPHPIFSVTRFWSGCLTTLGLGTAHFCQCWLRMRPRPWPSRPRPPFIQAPPHPRTPGTIPLPQHRKITWGAGRLRYPQLHWARRLHALLPSSSTPDVLLQPSSRHTWSPPILSLSLPLSSPRLLPEAAPWATGGAGLPALSRGPEAGRTGPLRGAAARARLTRAPPGLATRSAQAPLSRQRRSDGWRW